MPPEGMVVLAVRPEPVPLRMPAPTGAVPARRVVPVETVSLA